MTLHTLLFHIKKDARLRVVFFLLAAIGAQIAHNAILYHFQHRSLIVSDHTFVDFFYIISALGLAAYWHQLGPTRTTIGPSHHPVIKIILAAAFLFVLPPRAMSDNAAILFVYTFEALSCAILATAFFSIKFLRRFKFEIAFIALSSTLMKLLAFYVTITWDRLAWIVLKGVDLFFRLAHVPHSIDLTTKNVTLTNFSVNIGPGCAGIASITGFLILLVFMLMLMHERGAPINPRRLAAVTLGGIVMAYVLNIARIIAILEVGEHISPDFAVSTFHSTIGASLFLLFFTAYVFYATRWMTKTSV